jgi:hypothetical protein
MPWQSVQETYVFHWDGQAWAQAMRLCNTGLSDIAALGPGEVWFADPNQSRVLRFDGADWSWHPVWGHPRADGPAPTIAHLVAGPDGAVWGSGYGNYYGDLVPSSLARLSGGVWRAQPPPAEPIELSAIAGADADGLWGVTWDNRLLHVGPGRLTEVLRPSQPIAALSVVKDAARVPDVWMIGPASTVLHYRAPSADQLAPLATATPALPAPILRPTPTPFSVYDRDEAVERIDGLVDPEGTGETRLDSLRLVTVATWHQDWLPDFLDIPPSEDREYPWFWEQRGSLDPCDRGADLPVWIAEYSAAPRCPSHEFVVVDATGRDAWQLVCYPRRVATVYLPFLWRPRDPSAGTPTPTATAYTRDLTPEPVLDIQGACPTSTPWPDDPSGPYPGPGE